MSISAGARAASLRPKPRGFPDASRANGTRRDSGLMNPEDIFLVNWNASILGPPNTPFENRLYGLAVVRLYASAVVRARPP